MFEINVEYLTKDRQHQDVTINDILHSRLLVVPPEGHIWIILAKKKRSSSHTHLVNIRWPTNISKTTYNSSYNKELYQDTTKLLCHDGLDAIRKRGSNGNTSYTNFNILSLLKTKSAFIRKGRGVKLVKKEKVWNCYYLAAGGVGKREHMFNRVVSMWAYLTPRRGGQIQLNDEYLVKYFSVIKEMTVSK